MAKSTRMKGKMALYEWMRMQGPYVYGKGIFNLMSRWNKCINVFWDYVENNDNSLHYISYI
jgi:hypothetical protein